MTDIRSHQATDSSEGQGLPGYDQATDSGVGRNTAEASNRHANPLANALPAFTRYLIANQTLSESLHQVAELVTDALPQTNHVGITMMVGNKLQTSIFTHPEVPEIDQAQYRTGDGPCVDAYREGVPYIVGSTRESGPWQAFRDSAVRHGVLSTMSLPMITGDGAVGAMNLYAESEYAFAREDERVGLLFAEQAAFLLANAQAYWDARTLSENLQQAMESRAPIEQAKGIIMSSMSCGPDHAMQVLIRQSQEENIKLRDLAAELVRRASRGRLSSFGVAAEPEFNRRTVSAADP